MKPNLSRLKYVHFLESRIGIEYQVADRLQTTDTRDFAETSAVRAEQSAKKDKGKRSRARVLDWESEPDQTAAEPSSENVAEAAFHERSLPPQSGGIAQVPDSTADVVPQDATPVAGSGEPAGESSRDVSVSEDAKPQKKGMFSALSILPAISGVGSLLGLGKRESQPDKSTTNNSARDGPSQLRRDELAQGQGSSERVLDMGPLQGTQEPPSHDKSVDDTTGGALDTAVSLPNERAGSPAVPTPDFVLAEPTPIPAPAPEAIQDADAELHAATSKQKQTAQDAFSPGALDSREAIDGDTVATAVSSPDDSMDWEQDVKKKGKKGKNKRQSEDEPAETPEPAPEPIVEPMTQVSDTSVVGEDWADACKKGKKKKGKKGKALVELEPTVVEPEPALVEPELSPVGEAAPKEAESASVEREAEPIPAGEPAVVKEIAPVADVASTQSEPQDEWPDTVKKGKKSKKDKKKRGAPEPEPTVVEPDYVPVEHEVARVEAEPVPTEEPAAVPETTASSQPEPEDEWAEPAKKGKKGKKDKKKKGSTVEETVPEEPVVAPEPASKLEPEPIEAPVVAEETVLVTEPESVVTESIPSEGPVLAERDLVEEPVVDEATSTQPDLQDEWAETTTKKGKKSKKDKKKKGIVIEETSDEPIVSPPVDEPIVAQESISSTEPEPAFADDAPAPEPEIALPAVEEKSVETPFEVVPESTPQETLTPETLDPAPAEPEEHSWAEPTSKKKKKDKKKKQISPDQSVAEPEPTPDISAAATTVVEEPVQELPEPPSQQEPTMPGTLDTAPTETQDDWTGSSSKKAKKDKKKKGSIVTEEPEPAAPEPATPGEDAPVVDDAALEIASVVETEQVSVEEPAVEAETLAEPASKKSKKGKKKKQEAELAESVVHEPLPETSVSDPVAEPVLVPAAEPVGLTEPVQESVTEPVLEQDPQPVVESVPEPAGDLVSEPPATEATVSEPTAESETLDSSQETSIETADSWAETPKKGKGKKKKKDSIARGPEQTTKTPQPSEEPSEVEAVSEVPVDIPEAKTEVPPVSDAQEIVPVESTPASVEEPAEDVWAETSTKKGKKDKKKKKQSTQFSESFSPAEAVPEPSAALTEEPDQIKEGSVGEPASEPAVTPDTPETPEDAWAEPVAKKGKKKSVSEAFDISIEPEPTPEPAAEEVAQPGVAVETAKSVEPEPVEEAWPGFSSSRKKRDKKKKKQSISEVLDVGLEEVTIPTGELPAEPLPTVEPELPSEPAQADLIAAPVPRDDIEFTAAVAAGLQHTGFNPDLVIEDPIFRRKSPPGTDGESSPVEPIPSEPVEEEPWYEHGSVKQGKKNKKKKKGSKSPSPEESAVEEVESPSQPPPAESIAPLEPAVSEEPVSYVEVPTFDTSADPKRLWMSQHEPRSQSPSRWQPQTRNPRPASLQAKKTRSRRSGRA